MSKKKPLILASVCIVGLVVIVVTIYAISKHKQNSITTLSPILGYTAEEEASLPEVTKTFLQQVKCDVVETDNESHTAIVTVQAPDLTGVLQGIIEQTLEEDSDLEYEEQLSIAQNAFAEVIRDGNLPTREDELTLRIDEQTGEILPNDELIDFVFYDFRAMYADALYEAAGGGSDE